jgi:hypothetical protein
MVKTISPLLSLLLLQCASLASCNQVVNLKSITGSGEVTTGNRTVTDDFEYEVSNSTGSCS